MQVLVGGPGEVGELEPWVALGSVGELGVFENAAVDGEGLVGVGVGVVAAVAVGEDQAVFVLAGQAGVEVGDQALVNPCAVAGVGVAVGGGAPVDGADADAVGGGEVGEDGAHDVVPLVAAAVPADVDAGVPWPGGERGGVDRVVGRDLVGGP